MKLLPPCLRLPTRSVWLPGLAAMVLILSCSTLSAATVFRSGLLVVSERDVVLGSALEVGDIFEYTLSYDDAVLDSETDADYGQFTGAITSFTIVPQSVRAGIWSPSGSMGTGDVFTETGALQPWSFSVQGDVGYGPPVSGFSASWFYMGFGGLPANNDSGGGQTLGEVTGNVLDSVSMASDNYVELSFTHGENSHNVVFDLINFHAPEPSRSIMVLAGLVGVVWRRSRR